ncbi:helix-turn-helix transcriptional regulator [Actinomadura vinacea]|uniref:Helix-turn-helix transcriptional regulator n=1 Tax=Actinomadura vinacea TaxID=115336 RepID=A0ABN3IPT3_9ACTN
MGALTDEHPGDHLPAAGDPGPALHRMLLGARLRRLRETSGLTPLQAGAAIQVGAAEIAELERGGTGCRLREVIGLCDRYGVTDQAERVTLLQLARQANSPGWWAAYADVIPSWFERLVGLEQAAGCVRGFEVQRVPGLLQTPEYAAAAIRLGHGGEPARSLERRLEVRLLRQRVLRQRPPLRLWAIIDESVLRRPIGGRATLFRQLQHLIDMSELPNVTVQVLPFRAAGPAAGGPIVLLDMRQGQLGDIVFLEQLASARYVDGADEVSFYRQALDLLAVRAAPPEASRTILRDLARDL